MTDQYNGKYKNPDALAKQMDQLSDNIDIPTELNERQRRIVKYKLRGLSQTAIAQLEQVSQPMIAKEWRRIRQAFKEHGKNIDQNEVVGESVHLYKELEQEGWKLYAEARQNSKMGDANKALNTIMSAREKSINLLVDLGLIERAKVQHEHNVNLPPLLEKWKNTKDEEKKVVAEEVIDAQLEELEEPEPLSLPEDIQLEEPEPPNDDEGKS